MFSDHSVSLAAIPSLNCRSKRDNPAEMSGGLSFRLHPQQHPRGKKRIANILASLGTDFVLSYSVWFTAGRKCFAPCLNFARIFRPTHTLEPPGRNPIARSRHLPDAGCFFAPY